MSAEHAYLKPSSAGLTIKCHGSVKMQELHPEDEDSDNAKQGRLAHEVIVAYALDLPVPLAATDEMHEGGEIWLECVGPYIEGLHVEEKVDCSSVHELNWGTPDAWHFDGNAMLLRVWDYKFGHRYVEVYENWQLINYALGVVDQLRVDVSTLRIELTIVQPRCYHADGPVRTWALHGADLLSYAKKLQQAYDIAASDDAKTNAGGWCRDCSARHACPAVQSGAYHVVEFAGVTTPFNLDSHAISRELRIMREAQAILNARISGLEDEVLSRIKKGEAIPGWSAVQGTGREKWRVPVEEVKALGDMMGVSLVEDKPITPRQAVKKGLPEMVVAEYTERPAGEIKLVEETTTRAMQIFGGK